MKANTELKSYQYYKNFIENLNFIESHAFLMFEIGKLLGTGLRYEEVLQNQPLGSLRNYIQYKFQNNSIPGYESLVKFIFTRDLAYHPFGAWLRVKPLQLLQINSLSNSLTRVRYKDLNQIKLAGVLFALFIRMPVPRESVRDKISQLEKRISNTSGKTRDNVGDLIEFLSSNESRKIIWFANPGEIYFNASMSYTTLRTYLSVLNISNCYERYTFNGGNKTSLWVIYPDELMGGINPSDERETQLFNSLISGIDYNNLTTLKNITNERAFNTVKNNFERRFLHTNKKFFSNRPIPGFPFYRMDIYSESKDVYFPLKLANYQLMFAGIFGHLEKKFLQEKLGLHQATLLSLNSELSKFKSVLLEANLYKKYYPISTPNSPDEAGLHFNQIDETIKVISKLNKNGLNIDREKLHSIEESLVNYADHPLNGFYFFTDYSNENSVSIVNKWLTELKQYKYFSSGSGEYTKIHGYFTPHASSTHRMTCSRFNLQKMVKEIKSEFIKAPDGWVLLSADVSGQDIVVAANLAKRIFEDTNFRDYIDNEKIESLKNDIHLTLAKLSHVNNQIAKPIDFIADKIMQKHSGIVEGRTRATIRKNLKSIVYATFYGGSVRALQRAAQKELDVLIAELENDRGKIESKKFKLPKNFNFGDLNSRIRKVHRLFFQIINNDYGEVENEELEYGAIQSFIDEVDIKSMLYSESGDNLSNRAPIKVKILPQALKRKINPNKEFNIDLEFKGITDFDIANREPINFIKSNDVRNVSNTIMQILSEKEKYDAEIKFLNTLDKIFRKILSKEYPGILESLEFYETYSSKNNYLTYPTLLGFQTLTDPKMPFSRRYLKTRSKCYVIQASGAEFIRQWVIEISRIRGYENSFRLVNVIHDQVLLEVKSNWVEILKEELSRTVRLASEKVGLMPETIHIVQEVTAS